jgi:hypothetical protein
VQAGNISTLGPDILKMPSATQKRQEAECRIHIAAVPLLAGLYLQIFCVCVFALFCDTCRRWDGGGWYLCSVYWCGDEYVDGRMSLERER